jgi:hypothetical protein
MNSFALYFLGALFLYTYFELGPLIVGVIYCFLRTIYFLSLSH